jgi:hypothetical protein
MTSQHEVVESKRMEKKDRKGILRHTFNERLESFAPCFCSYTRFSTSGFFHESVSHWPLSILLGPLKMLTKFCGDIHNFLFIAGVNKPCEKLFADVNDTE